MARKSLISRIGAGRDEGSALVAVIGVMVVLTVLVMTIMSTALFNVRATTETRASVQARAAAEAGIAFVRAQLSSGVCTSGTVTSPVGSPKFTVTIHPSSTTPATSGSPIACPGATSSSYVLVATGAAASRGVGSTSGNTRKVEALLKSAVSVAPKFNAAIYSGQSANVNTDLTLTGTGADIVTGGNWTCSTKQSITGSLYAGGDVLFSSGPCTIKGSVYSEGAFACPSASSIDGNLYVQKGAEFKTVYCTVGGEVWTGGSVSASHGLKVAKDFTVKGDIAVAGLPSVGGKITAAGKIDGGSGYWYDQIKAAHPTAAQNQVVGLPPSGKTVVNMDFPKVRQSDPMFSGFTAKSWTSSTNPLRNSGSSMSTCNMNWGGAQFTSPLVVTENTVFDTTLPGECGSQLLLGGTFTIKLNADAVIFAKNFKMSGDVRVESADGKAHSLYLITPYPLSQTSCAAPTESNEIEFTSGSWTQGLNTSVLLYSAGLVEFKSKPVLRGQIYSCRFSAQTAVSMEFSKTGASTVDPSTVKPSLEYVRDVSS